MEEGLLFGIEGWDDVEPETPVILFDLSGFKIGRGVYKAHVSLREMIEEGGVSDKDSDLAELSDDVVRLIKAVFKAIDTEDTRIAKVVLDDTGEVYYGVQFLWKRAERGETLH